MTNPRYVFESLWSVKAPREKVFDVLEDVPNYPKWFSLIKEVETIEDGSYRYICKSVLPYELKFDTKATVNDRMGGVLEASMVGDLEGFSRWSIAEVDDVVVVRYFEDVVTNKRLLNVLEPVARPAFNFNHWLAMRSGERGLRKLLS